jgi:hypothetical protein
MPNKDGMAKNLDVIKDEFYALRKEWLDNTSKLFDSLKAGRVIRVLFHHSHGYVEPIFDNMPRLCSYLVYPVIAWHWRVEIKEFICKLSLYFPELAHLFQ